MSTITQLLNAKQALFQHKSDWHADPRSMSKREYLNRLEALRATVAALQVQYEAEQQIGAAL
jgi:hypothetical protein